jgi:cytochrome c oxidase cbb3-type subunit 3
MTSFTDGFWNMLIFICSVGGIIALFLFIKVYSTGVRGGETTETTGHIWDVDLKELNNPLPRWWLNMFYITLIWGVIYLLLYPGVGTHPMLLGWSSVGQYEEQMAAANERYGPLYERFVSEDIAVVAKDPEALKMGRRLFLNYCAGCHGSDAGGFPGFPNLRDGDWIHGGSPEEIKTSIIAGRNGVMPPWAEAAGEEGVAQLTQYVISLNGRDADEAQAQAGEAIFKTLCVACHGADGTGNKELGAPNLTNNVWLYGGSPKAIADSIANGRMGQMPAHGDFLGEAKSHLLAAYVYSLTNQ